MYSICLYDLKWLPIKLSGEHRDSHQTMDATITTTTLQRRKNKSNTGETRNDQLCASVVISWEKSNN